MVRVNIEYFYFHLFVFTSREETHVRYACDIYINGIVGEYLDIYNRVQYEGYS